MHELSITIDEVNVGKDYIVISWSANIGFGELTIYKNGEEWIADTEYLGKSFVKAILNEWINTMKIK